MEKFATGEISRDHLELSINFEELINDKTTYKTEQNNIQKYIKKHIVKPDSKAHE